MVQQNKRIIYTYTVHVRTRVYVIAGEVKNRQKHRDGMVVMADTLITTNTNVLSSRDAYYVPTTRFVTSREWSPPDSLAKPKSEILGV